MGNVNEQLFSFLKPCSTLEHFLFWLWNLFFFSFFYFIEHFFGEGFMFLVLIASRNVDKIIEFFFLIAFIRADAPVMAHTWEYVVGSDELDR